MKVKVRVLDLSGSERTVEAPNPAIAATVYLGRGLEIVEEGVVYLQVKIPFRSWFTVQALIQPTGEGKGNIILSTVDVKLAREKLAEFRRSLN